MMKNIKTLVKDIRGLILAEAAHVDTVVREFGQNLAGTLANRLAEEKSAPSLRLSNLGTPDRKLWYTINKPEWAEPLSASSKFKFLFGDVIEEVLLYLASAAGHTVTDRQKEVSVHGVKGHIDAVIDGELVDVKSASSLSFKKFENGLTPAEDGFGYLTQLGSYASATGNSRGHFLVADKTLGHLTLDTHDFPPRDLEREINRKREMLASPLPPARCYPDEAETYYRKPTGNRKLNFKCGYCPFKRRCWPNVTPYLVGDRPVFYTVAFNPRGTPMNWKELPE